MILRTNIAASVGAITAPMWLPTLHAISATFAEIAPIAGVVALVVNTALVIRRELRRG